MAKAQSTMTTTTPLPGYERNDRVCDMVVALCGLVLIAEATCSRKGPAEAGGAAEGTPSGRGPAWTHPWECKLLSLGIAPVFLKGMLFDPEKAFWMRSPTST